MTESDLFLEMCPIALAVCAEGSSSLASEPTHVAEEYLKPTNCIFSPFYLIYLSRLALSSKEKIVCS